MARATPLPQPPGTLRWALAGGALGVLCGALLFAPARWLTGAVERATEGRVLLNDARGTVWTGSAQLQLTGGAGSSDTSALPSRVDWRIRPSTGGLVALLGSACCIDPAVKVSISPRWYGVRLAFADAQTRWPAALLSGLGTPWNTLQFDGDLLLATRGLSVEWLAGRMSVAGQAELTAQRLSSRLSTLRPMGSYRITLTGGDTTAVRLDTLEGSLQLSGTGQWVGSRLRFSGTASAAPEREAALSNLLNIIGQRRGPRSIITIG